MMKKAVMIFAAVILIGMLSGCLGKGGEEPFTSEPPSTVESVQTQAVSSGETEESTHETSQTDAVTTQAETTKEEKKEIPKISPTDLLDANSISFLLNTYPCVRVERTFEFGKQIEQYSRLNEDIIQIIKVVPNGEKPYYYGRYGGFYYEVQRGRTKAYIMFDDLNRAVTPTFDNTVAGIFNNSKVSFVKESSENYVLKVTYPDMSVDEMAVTVTVRKDTLSIVKAVFKSEGEVTETLKCTLDVDTKDYADILSGWHGPKKTVTINAEKIKGNNRTEKHSELQLPLDWEVFINDSSEVTFYMDSDHTVPYKYPGNGKDYKIYATSSSG